MRNRQQTLNALRFYIGGEWVDPLTSRTLDVINPATEKPMGRISLGSAADVDRAVAAARIAFESFSHSSVEERIILLERILALYKQRWDDIAEVIRLEMGAPVTLARGAQTGSGYAAFESALQALKGFEFEYRHGNTQIMYEPIGVCGLITPWNWPINQVAHKVSTALACGCSMVLKPSEIAPFDAMILAEILHEAGVPAGVFNLVNGDGPTVGETMSAHAGIDMMSFTGSTRAGTAVARAAAATVKRVAQELGGKSPNIILDDVDLEKAITAGVQEMMSNTGQSCNAPSRMLVPAGLLAEAEEIAARAAESIVVGDPRDEATTMGPLVSELSWNKVQGLIQKGVEEGCKLIAGGPGKPARLATGYYAKPTVFSSVTNGQTIAVEEIFGPVLTILTYADVDEAVAIANATLYGLSAYVASSDIDRANSVARRLRAGNVHINGQWGDRTTPFGGYKQSGNGREGGVYGFPDFLEIKAVMGYH